MPDVQKPFEIKTDASALGAWQDGRVVDSEMLNKAVFNYPTYEKEMYTIVLADWRHYLLGKVTPKASNGHEYILVAINYFTKCVEAASSRILTSAKVTKFEKRIRRYGVPHEARG